MRMKYITATAVVGLLAVAPAAGAATAKPVKKAPLCHIAVKKHGKLVKRWVKCPTATNGVNGATGANGAAGSNGVNGTNGAAGAQGATGAAGVKGATGANG